eukprot:scaffold533_cov369-Prasinococcus_capsulatus_cf.AAC.2
MDTVRAAAACRPLASTNLLLLWLSPMGCLLPCLDVWRRAGAAQDAVRAGAAATGRPRGGRGHRALSGAGGRARAAAARAGRERRRPCSPSSRRAAARDERAQRRPATRARLRRREPGHRVLHAVPQPGSVGRAAWGGSVVVVVVAAVAVVHGVASWTRRTTSACAFAAMPARAPLPPPLLQLTTHARPTGGPAAAAQGAQGRARCAAAQPAVSGASATHRAHAQQPRTYRAGKRPCVPASELCNHPAVPAAVDALVVAIHGCGADADEARGEEAGGAPLRARRAAARRAQGEVAVTRPASPTPGAPEGGVARVTSSARCWAGPPCTCESCTCKV